MKIQSFFQLTMIAWLLASFGNLAHAQTMDELMEQMVEDSKKGQATGTYNNYSSEMLGNSNNYSNELLGQQQPMTREQAQQHTTNNLLRTLSEVSKRPEGETRYERNQRLSNLTNQMRNENAAISQRQNEYNQARMRRLMGGSSTTARPSIDHGGTADYSDYARKRAARLNKPDPTLDIPVRGTTSTYPDAKPAGFGEGYAGGYKRSDTTLEPSGIITNSSRRARRRDLEAGPVIIVKDDPPQQRAKETKYCKCRGSDHTDMTGIMCLNLKTNNSYQSGYYPWTSQCFRSVTSYVSPTQ